MTKTSASRALVDPADVGVPMGVAAASTGIHPQTIRLYERRGLVRPKRTSGNLRQYSIDDLHRLRRIHVLTTKRGVNLSGVRRVLDLEDELHSLVHVARGLATRIRKLDAGAAVELRDVARETKRMLPSTPARLALPPATPMDE